ncbi:hypothetical protein SD70_07945 [Gordoniibacillus kamchatkensis]|uniref:Neutral/alkaline non-lysosomal ceramidase N-terminal domain-containing protein n=1 Tax=Gordoniibacillus kamchatkensis TaxID=1590651 RepID=A0ABR5AKC8_9BACL|nr:neutral/alkaline non-lysosomal ceramidase N-terminal domain-containing protein [Paenibacillus sp. VKM B-2647]KIL41362.1 hypothetical protein SD70_07945 [Paenibacillus sp. VKM B-2647]
MPESGFVRLGCAKADITPQHPLPLAGFAHRSGNYERIDKPLYARILFFAPGENRQALIVSADLLSWGDEITDKLKSALGKRWGLTNNQIVLHATHSHSGPQTAGGYTELLGEPDSGYVALLQQRILEAVERAAAAPEHVYPERGSGRCELGVYRRKRADGLIRMAPNPDVPIDHDVSVVRYAAADGRAKAVLVHYACHPTVSGDNTLSPEYPGVAMEAVEQSLGGEAVSVFLQGACADVRPALVRDGEFYRGGYAEVEAIGRKLADEVVAILAKPMTRLAPGSLAARSALVPLRLQEPPSREQAAKWAYPIEGDAGVPNSPQPAPPGAAVQGGAVKQLAPDANVLKAWSRHLIDRDKLSMDSVELKLGYVELAEGFALLCANAEMSGEYGAYLKSRFAGRVLPVCYCDGMLGYVCTAEQLAEGGYEAVDYIYYFGLPAPLAPEAEEAIRTAMEELVHGR